MGVNIEHALSVGTAMVEGLFFGGLIFGWSSIAPVLQCEGYFQDTCHTNYSTACTIDKKNTTAPPLECISQKESLVLGASIGLFCYSLGLLLAGFIFDKHGTMITRFLGTIVLTAGIIILAFSSEDSSWTLYPGVALMATGGASLLLTNLKLGNLFPSKRATLISAMEGCIDASAITFLFIKLAYEAGITLQTSFLFIAVCTVFVWIRTVFLMPRMYLPFTLPQGKYHIGVYRECFDICQNNSNNADTEVNRESPTPAGSLSIFYSLKDLRFWLNVAHFSVLRLRQEMFLSTLGDWLEASFSQYTSSQLNTYINVFGIQAFSVALLSPLHGLCLDLLLKRFRKQNDSDERIATAKAVAISLSISSVTGIVFSIAVCIPNLPFQYVSFISFSALVACIFGGNSSFNALVFPEGHFGRLNGISLLVSSLFTLTKYPLAIVVFRVLNGNFLPLHLCLTIACLLTLLHPILYYKITIKQIKGEPGSVTQSPHEYANDTFNHSD